MVDARALRFLALALPEVEDASSGLASRFEVAGKGFAWTYWERIAPRKPRQARPDVLAVRCDREAKEMLIAAAPDRFFDDDRCRGYPAVLVRLGAIDAGELEELLRRAWRLPAPRRLARDWDDSQTDGRPCPWRP
jgi:hypothetical protein